MTFAWLNCVTPKGVNTNQRSVPKVILPDANGLGHFPRDVKSARRTLRALFDKVTDL